MTPIELKKAMFGFTIVTKLSLDVNRQNWSTTLVLELAKGEQQDSGSIRVTFRGVSGLKLVDFGGGLTQFLHLDVKDLRNQQLDSVSFHIYEEERGTISFMCESFEKT